MDVNEDVAYGPQIGMDDPWVMMRESGAYFFQTDHLNSVTELTDENEAVQNEYRYKAFGEALQAVEMVENEYQFTARRRDGVDGLQFNRFRHYQPQFGRWNQWDRIRYGDGPNMYGYVGNVPVVFKDGYGLWGGWTMIGIGLGGIIGGIIGGGVGTLAGAPGTAAGIKYGVGLGMLIGGGIGNVVGGYLTYKPLSKSVNSVTPHLQNQKNLMQQGTKAILQPNQQNQQQQNQQQQSSCP